jgi:hypothetical protein
MKLQELNYKHVQNILYNYKLLNIYAYFYLVFYLFLQYARVF